MTEYANKLILLLFPLCGFALLTGGVLLRRRLADRVKDFKWVSGVVVDSIKGSSGGLNGDTVFFPVVEYYVEGRRLTVVGGVGYGKRKREGHNLVVLYSPMNPTDSVVREGYYYPAEMALMIGGAIVAGCIWFAYLISIS